MAFSYNLSSSDGTTAAIAAVRLEIGDNVEDSGVLPDGGNLQDDEIEWYLTQADDDRAAATLLIVDMLARRWAMAVDVAVGPRRESLSQVARRWQEIGQEMRSAGDVGAGASFSFAPQRDDGFAEYAE